MLARSSNSSKSLAQESLKNPEVREWIIRGMEKVIQYELKKLCSDDANSVQQSKEKEKICNFPWKEVIAEIIKYCPTLYKLLLSGTTTKAVRQNRQHLICTIVCMLCKFRKPNMSLLQRLVSTLLYASHAGTGVCTIN